MYDEYHNLCPNLRQSLAKFVDYVDLWMSV